MILGYEANIGLIYYGPKWSWAEMVMGRNGHGPKLLWAEMTRNHRNDFLPMYANQSIFSFFGSSDGLSVKRFCNLLTKEIKYLFGLPFQIGKITSTKERRHTVLAVQVLIINFLSLLKKIS